MTTTPARPNPATLEALRAFIARLDFDEERWQPLGSISITPDGNLSVTLSDHYWYRDCLDTMQLLAKVCERHVPDYCARVNATINRPTGFGMHDLEMMITPDTDVKSYADWWLQVNCLWGLEHFCHFKDLPSKVDTYPGEAARYTVRLKPPPLTTLSMAVYELYYYAKLRDDEPGLKPEQRGCTVTSHFGYPHASQLEIKVTAGCDPEQVIRQLMMQAKKLDIDIC